MAEFLEMDSCDDVFFKKVDGCLVQGEECRRSKVQMKMSVFSILLKQRFQTLTLKFCRFLRR